MPDVPTVVNTDDATMRSNKKRKIVRRLVDKMYIDEDGSMGKVIIIMPLINSCYSY